MNGNNVLFSSFVSTLMIHAFATWAQTIKLFYLSIYDVRVTTYWNIADYPISITMNTLACFITTRASSLFT